MGNCSSAKTTSDDTLLQLSREDLCPQYKTQNTQERSKRGIFQTQNAKVREQIFLQQQQAALDLAEDENYPKKLLLDRQPSDYDQERAQCSFSVSRHDNNQQPIGTFGTPSKVIDIIDPDGVDIDVRPLPESPAALLRKRVAWMSDHYGALANASRYQARHNNTVHEYDSKQDDNHGGSIQSLTSHTDQKSNDVEEHLSTPGQPKGYTPIASPPQFKTDYAFSVSSTTPKYIHSKTVIRPIDSTASSISAAFYHSSPEHSLASIDESLRDSSTPLTQTHNIVSTDVKDLPHIADTNPLLEREQDLTNKDEMKENSMDEFYSPAQDGRTIVTPKQQQTLNTTSKTQQGPPPVSTIKSNQNKPQKPRNEEKKTNNRRKSHHKKHKSQAPPPLLPGLDALPGRKTNE